MCPEPSLDPRKECPHPKSCAVSPSGNRLQDQGSDDSAHGRLHLAPCVPLQAASQQQRAAVIRRPRRETEAWEKEAVLLQGVPPLCPYLLPRFLLLC